MKTPISRPPSFFHQTLDTPLLQQLRDSPFVHHALTKFNWASIATVFGNYTDIPFLALQTYLYGMRYHLIILRVPHHLRLFDLSRGPFPLRRDPREIRNKTCASIGVKTMSRAESVLVSRSRWTSLWRHDC